MKKYVLCDGVLYSVTMLSTTVTKYLQPEL